MAGRTPRHALPRISVVTSSYNQGAFIARTIESVLAQGYPDIEHIVVDGMSTDDTPSILARYPHVRVIREPDSGQADAINKGFRQATGQILCFLNSDDTFEPGALHRVAKELDPAIGRHVVMGRCRFVDEHDRFIGIEHPSAFESHTRVLAIWKGYCIPQPAVFWTREVWERCGPLNEQEQLLLDYDLFCRFSREYRFHTFDQIVATYRLHSTSKTQSVDEERRLADAVRVSRKYWKPWWTLQGLTLRGSYFWYLIDRRGRAYRWLQAGRAHWRDGRYLAATGWLLSGAALGPDVSVNAAAAPLARRFGKLARSFPGLGRSGRGSRRMPPQTAAWTDFTGIHADGWGGPHVSLPFELGASGSATLRVEGHVPVTARGRTRITLQIETRPPSNIAVEPAESFAVRLPVADLEPGHHVLDIRADRWFTPDELWGNRDFRPLSFRITRFEVEREGHA